MYRHLPVGLWKALLTLSLLVPGIAGLQACQPPGIAGTGRPRTELRDFEPFSGVSIDNGFTLTFKQNNQRSRHEVKITIDDNLSQLVSTSVSNGRLSVKLLQPVSTADRKVEIEGPTLQYIALNTRSRGTVDKLTGRSQVQIDLRNDSQLNVGEIQADNTQVYLSGLSQLVLSGGASSSLTATLNSKSQLDSSSLRTARLDATLTQESGASVQALQLLSVSLSDRSSLEYTGTPQIQQRVLTRDSKLRPAS